MILIELARLGRINAIDVINMENATIKDNAVRDDTAAISSVKVKIIPTEDGNIVEREVKLHDKIKALELVGKHLGMFNEKLKIEGSLPVVITGEDELED